MFFSKVAYAARSLKVYLLNWAPFIMTGDVQRWLGDVHYNVLHHRTLRRVFQDRSDPFSASATASIPCSPSVCQTPACVHVASSLLQALDTSTDPCMDFFRSGLAILQFKLPICMVIKPKVRGDISTSFVKNT